MTRLLSLMILMLPMIYILPSQMPNANNSLIDMLLMWENYSAGTV